MEHVNVDKLKLYYKDRPEDVASLTEEIRLTLEQGLSKEVADKMLEDEDIKSTLTKYPEIQQLSLHIYFNKLLLRFGYLTNTDTTHLINLIRYNELAVWANSLRQYVLPFIVENHVMEIVYNLPISKGDVDEVQSQDCETK